MSVSVIPDEALEGVISSLGKRVIAAYDAGDKATARELDQRRMLASQLRSEAQIARMEREKGLV